MAKIGGLLDPSLNVPPEYVPLIEKIIRWYDNQIYPVWGLGFFHTTRSAKNANKERTFLKEIGASWQSIGASARADWSSASAFLGLNGYQLFTSNYSYRKKQSLDLPGLSNQYHQLFALRLLDDGSWPDNSIRYDTIVVTGPIDLSFNYRLVNQGVSPNSQLRCDIEAHYFEAGENKIDTATFTLNYADDNWHSYSNQFLVSDRFYFHLIVSFRLIDYPSEVHLDNLLIQHNSDDILREGFFFKAGKSYAPVPLYRKEGWVFSYPLGSSALSVFYAG